MLSAKCGWALLVFLCTLFEFASRGCSRDVIREGLACFFFCPHPLLFSFGWGLKDYTHCACITRSFCSTSSYRPRASLTHAPLPLVTFQETTLYSARLCPAPAGHQRCRLSQEPLENIYSKGKKKSLYWNISFWVASLTSWNSQQAILVSYWWPRDFIVPALTTGPVFSSGSISSGCCDEVSQNGQVVSNKDLFPTALRSGSEVSVPAWLRSGGLTQCQGEHTTDFLYPQMTGRLRKLSGLPWQRH